MNTKKTCLGPLTMGRGTQTTLAAFLEAKKAKEIEKATQRAVMNCGRAGFRINASTCKYIFDSVRERSCSDKPWVEGCRFHSLGFKIGPKVSSHNCCRGLLE